MKALKVIAVILAVILLLLLLTVVFLETRKNEPEQTETPTTETQDTSGTLSWEAYMALSLEEQDAYSQQFASAEAFEKWLESVRPTESTVQITAPDWSDKKPDQYTWEEYLALSREEQDAFFLWFASTDAFEAWMDQVKPAETEPTEGEKPGQTDNPGQTNKPEYAGKKPSEYTWEEYKKLSQKEQEDFYQWFGSAEAFEQWMEKVKPVETEPTVPSWNKPGKKPDEYTWAEYEALSREEQEAFYLWFGSQYAFEAWMESVKPAETEPTIPAWDKEKKPSEYTWEEFEALTDIEQEAFYLWFDSQYAFEAWMESVKPAETEPTIPVWDKEKKPSEYTWEEFEALTAIEKESFYQWFATNDAFQEWMDSVQ